jgi:hypothetical protein
LALGATGTRRYWHSALLALGATGTRRYWHSALLALGATLTIGISPTNAADFSTTNTGALTHFWSAIESSNRPVTIVSFGDSMADSYRSVTYHLMNRLNNQFGNCGYSLNNYRNTAMWQLENGASNRGPDQYWFCNYQQIPAGGAVWWANQPNPTGVLCDQAGIFYVSQFSGGQFRLMLSTNGGTWSTVMTLNGYNLTPTGHFASVSLPLNRYRLRVEGDSGTNFIIGTSTVATQTNGIHSVFMEWPGIGLNQVTNVPLAIRAPILAELKPDLLIWHMKEDGSLMTSNRMKECEDWWQNSAPNTDVIYIGTPWISWDIGTTWTPDQNMVVRNISLSHHRTYADIMQPTISYDWLITNNFMLTSDGIHLTPAGGVHCANIMWDDLGFFALGLDRRLTLQPNGTQMQLSYHTSNGARYRLEASTNLQNWSVILTNPVATTTFTTNFPAPPGPTYYRLGLTPP